MGVDAIISILGLVTQTLEGLLTGDAKKADQIAENLVKIAQAANGAYQEQTGQPIDPSLLKPIDKV